MKRVERIDAVLSEVLSKAKRQYEVLDVIQKAWPKLLGERLAGHTRPMSLHQGRLTVHVDQPGDHFALRYRKERLLRELQSLTDGRVEQLVVRVGPVE